MATPVFSHDHTDVYEDAAEIYITYENADYFDYHRYAHVIVKRGSTTVYDEEVESIQDHSAYSSWYVWVGGLASDTRYTWTATLGWEDSAGTVHWTTTTCSGNFRTLAPAKTRPDNWYWPSGIASGRPISNLTATQWNNFCDRINEFLEYQDKSTVSFRRASGTLHMAGSGTVTSSQLKLLDAVNAARSAIARLDGHGQLPSVMYSTWTITAEYFEVLANAMNAVD